MWFKTFILTFLIAGSVFAEPKKNQIDSIFIWKISDELKLTVADEKKFTDIFQSLSVKKNDLLTEQQKVLNEIDTIVTQNKFDEKKNSDLLKDYRKKLADINKVNTDEFDQLKALFGDKKMLQYLKVKNDVTNKLKTLLINEKKDEKKPLLPTPKIIEKE